MASDDVTNDGERQVDPDPAHRARYQLAADAIAREETTGGEIILDWGCGTGYGATYFPAYSYLGIDRSRAAIAYATEHYGRRGASNGRRRAEFLVGNVETDYAFLRGTYGLAFECLEHFMTTPAHMLRLLLHATPQIYFSVPYLEPGGANPHHEHFELTPVNFADLADIADLRFWWADGRGQTLGAPPAVTLLGYADARR